MLTGCAPSQHPETHGGHQGRGQINASGGFVESPLDLEKGRYREGEHSAQRELAEHEQKTDREFRHSAIVAGEGKVRILLAAYSEYSASVPEGANICSGSVTPPPEY